MIRIDEEASTPMPEADLDRLLAAIHPLLDDRLAAIILSDYNKGTLPEPICCFLIAAANRRGIPILVDPKWDRFRKYAGATTLTPNIRELEVAVGLGELAEPALYEAAHRFRESLGLDFFVVTRGHQGLSVFDDRGVGNFPALAREVFDVCGAGDTVIATLAAGLVAGLDRDNALRLANLAAGIVVGKAGTTPIRREELLGVLTADQSSVGPSTKLASTGPTRNTRPMGDRGANGSASPMTASTGRTRESSCR